MKTIAASLLLTMMLALPPSSRAEEGGPALSLGEAVRIALANNHALLSERDKLRASEAGVGEAVSAFLPRVNVSETFMRSDNPVAVFGAKLNQRGFTASDFAIDRLNNPSPVNDWGLQVEVIKPLFDGGREFVGLKRARLGELSARMALERARMETVYEVAQAYWGVALAGRYVEAAELAKKSTEGHLKLAQALYGQGMVIGSEVLLAKVRLAEVDEMLITARDRLATAKAALNMALARPQDTPFTASDALEYREFNGSLSGLMAEALKRRPDLKGMDADVRGMDEGVRMARTDYLPSLDLIGRYNLDTRDLAGRGGDSYTIMGQVTWNIFDGFLTTNRVREAGAKRNALSHAYDGMREEALFEVRKAFYDLDAARQRIEVSSAAVSEGEESLRILKDRFRAGMARTIDVLDAETALTRARTNRAQALYDYNVALAALDLAVGREGVSP